MVQFTKVDDSTIYTASSNSNGNGWWAWVLTEKGSGTRADPPDGPLALSEAVDWSGSGWSTSFVYILADGPLILENTEEFTKRIADILAPIGGDGAIFFLPTGIVNQIARDVGKVFPLSRSTGELVILGPPPVNLTGVRGVHASFATGAVLSVPPKASEKYILVTPTGPHNAIELAGPWAPDAAEPDEDAAELYFEGEANGAFRFDLLLLEPDLTRKTDMGFQVIIPDPSANNSDENGPTEQLSAYLPLAEYDEISRVFVGFTGQVNPVNPNNLAEGVSQSTFFFTGQSVGATSETTVFPSYYRTNFGKHVMLRPDPQGKQPARMVFNLGVGDTILQHGFRFSPVGDFAIRIDDTILPETPHMLLCGLSGTETVAVVPEVDGSQKGERIRFVMNQAANVPVFPLKAVSPIGTPLDPKAMLMDKQFMTSWATFVPPPDGPVRKAHYSAAPKGAELFGANTSTVTGLLGPEDPGVGLHEDGNIYFPMFPMAGFKDGSGQQDMTSEQLQGASRQIISPTRKTQINAGNKVLSASAASSLQLPTAASAQDRVPTTTPTGFITRYDGSNGTFGQLLLSQVQNKEGSITRQMGFTGLGDDLQSAFQTNDQFLVICNNKDDRLGGTPPEGLKTFMPPSSEDIFDESYFFNGVDIGKWSFVSPTGTNNNYGDYRNVILVKGVKGKIFDPDPVTGAATENSLVRSPDKWTMKEVFAAPAPPDMSQLVSLSNWLADYCKDAYDRRDNEYFRKFSKIITDENWTGVLILKAGITSIPKELTGILSGVENFDDFYAHHLGIEIGQIDPVEVQQKDSSSMFGLVYYVDPSYDDAELAHTIAPSNLDAPFDFKLLTLKALFENSTIKKFESLAQVVLNSVMGATVSEMIDVKPEGRETNPNNAVLLEGGVQKNGDTTIYSLASKWPNQYILKNNVLTSVEIDTAQMSTRDDGSTSGKIVSWIGMTGFMNFSVIPSPTGDDPLPDFDLFSFGPEKDEDGGDKTPLRRGLNFNNMGLRITSPSDPDKDPTPALLELVEDEMGFNTQGSHAREQSLYRGFQLELLDLMSGNANPGDGGDKSDPVGLGFLPAITQYNLRGVTGGEGGWHGLHFKLNLGTPGALAGKINLDSSMLLAWADDSGADPDDDALNASVGIDLPGAGSGGDLFSLQTVIKLSVGIMQLMYTEPQLEKDEQGGYLLVLNEIALKLLGLLKIPPSGNTAFMLFGNQKATDSTGLGWFAIYNKAKEAEKAKAASALPERVGGRK